MHDVLPLLRTTDFPSIRRNSVETLQVNLGYRCNQSCLHCHVNAGPNRKEEMTLETISQVIEFLDSGENIHTLDLTGGAPEMHSQFKMLVQAARQRGIKVIDRCNLTILLEPGYEDMAQFLASQQATIVASLPCYLEENVNNQRGKGVFKDSISALQQLNALGYGKAGSNLELNLVYNPQGPDLPPPQMTLEADYRQHLSSQYNVTFSQLFTLANMPIQRFGSTLISKNRFHSYMDLLKSAHQDSNLDSVMCKTTVSVDYQGYLFDCDFNQMLKLPLRQQNASQSPLHISNLNPTELDSRNIIVADHCYGCTAGQGSSCGGALAS